MQKSGAHSLFQSLLLLIAAVILPVNANAAPVTMDFEGFDTFEAVFDYYDAGMGHLGSGPGPDWGIVMDTAASITAPVLVNLPSPNAAMGIDAQPGNQLIVNATAGLVDAVSFSYSSENIRATLSVYDGVDGTGALLATTTLEPPYITPTGPTGTTFDTWLPINLPFAGTARSIVILMTDDLQPGGGTLDSRRSFWLDDFGVDSLVATPTPAPSNLPVRPVPAMNSISLLFLCAGLLAVVALRFRRSEG